MIDQQLRITTFGGFSVELNGKPVTEFVSRKVVGLLVYLLSNRRAIPREILADMFWDKLPPARALANLRTALWDLQHNLGDFLQISNQTVEIRADVTPWFDVAVVEQALVSLADSTPVRNDSPLSVDDAWQLSQALALYRGDFLDGFFLRDSEVFESWLNAERERLRKRIAGGLHRLALAAIHHQDFAEGITIARRMVAIEPTSEESHRLLMTLLAYDNQRASALTQFQICKQILAESFGIEPSHETLSLYEQIQADLFKKLPAIEPVLSNHNNLPNAPTAFVERPDEIQKIAELLDRPDCNLLTLLGPGGMGKSRLALQTAWHSVANSRYRDGVFFVAMAGVNAVETIPSSILLAMRVNLQGQSDLKAQMFDYLRDKQVLLVIDNFEQLLAGALILSDLLAEAPHVQILVTSRERLNIQEEWLLEIEGMAFPTDLAEINVAAPVSQYGALALFSQTARRVYPDFSLEANPELTREASRVCQLVEGMPLGIELAAVHLRFMSCRDIVEQIERDLDFLSTNLHNVPERHRSVRALFEQSLKRLSVVEKTAFMKLAVFQGGVDRQAAESVAGATLSILTTLVENSLVHFSSSGRYEMHQLVHRYALEGLTATGALLTVQGQHCVYFLNLLETIDASADFVPFDQNFYRLEIEQPNVLAALEWAYAQQKTDLLLRLCGALRAYWQAHGTYQEGYRWLTQALDLLERSPTRTLVEHEIEIRALDAAGIMAWLFGELGNAELWLLRSLQLRRARGYTKRMCEILDYVSLTYLNTNAFDRALPYIQEALDLAQQQGDKAAVAQELLTFGLYATHITEWDKALGYLQESLKMFEEQHNLDRVQVVLTNMAVVRIKQERYVEAQACCERALAILGDMQINVPHSKAVIYGNMGEIAQKFGDFTLARRRYIECVRMLRQIGDKMNIAYILESFGSLAILEQHAESGVVLFGAATALRNVLGAFISPREAKEYARSMELAHNQLADDSFARAWSHGQSLSMDQAIDLAITGNVTGTA